MTPKKIVIFNGSPRRSGTSFRFAEAFQQLAETAGCPIEILHIIDFFDQKEPFINLKRAMTESDIIGLFAPLYVDSLPSIDLWFLEKLAVEFNSELRGKCFFAVGQHGYPDVTVCEPLLGTCRCFAAAAEMKWLGGLAYGSGGMLNGAPLHSLGRKGKKITAAFKQALDDILCEKAIRPEVQQMLKKAGELPKMLNGLGAILLNIMMNHTARKLGATDVRRKVYL